MKASYKARAINGNHLSGIAVYGYSIDPNDKTHMVIDPVAADIVRQIFRLFLDGCNISEIARILNREGIDAPREYKLNHGIEISKGKVPLVEIPPGWRQHSVRRVLDDYRYCGHSVSLKSKTTSYVTHERVRIAPEDWIIVRNTHDPIITEETFEEVQKIRKCGKKVAKNQCDKGPLNLMIYCADCGSKMYFHSRRKSGTGSFICGSHSLYKNCTPHSIPRDILEAGVLENLQKVISFVNCKEDEFLSLFNCRKKRESVISSKARTEIETTLERANEIDAIINRLFEQNVSGVLSDKRFQTMLTHYETEQNSIRDKIDKLQNLVSDSSDENQSVSDFVNLVQKYTKIKKLTPEIARAFIKRVLVEEPTGSNNGATSGKMTALSCTYDKTATLTANAFKRTGYTFAGWNTEPDGNGTAYANKAKVLNLTSDSGAKITLYAQWTPNN